MEESPVGHEIRCRQSRTSVDFDFSAFEELPDNTKARIEWTEGMDTALLKYWPIKVKKDVAKLLGVSEGRARERWIELTKKS